MWCFVLPSLLSCPSPSRCLSLTVEDLILAAVGAGRSALLADAAVVVLLNDGLIGVVGSSVNAASKIPPRKITAANVHNVFSIFLFVCRCRVRGGEGWGGKGRRGGGGTRPVYVEMTESQTFIHFPPPSSQLPSLAKFQLKSREQKGIK